MSSPDAPVAVETAPGRDRRYWLAVLARAIVALAAAAVITFSSDHSAPLGFATFGGFAIVSALVMGSLAVTTRQRSTERSFIVVQAAVGLIAGVISLVSLHAGVAFFLFLVSAWAIVAGVLELYIGVRSRRRIAEGRDWLFIGALTLVLGIVVLLVPANLTQEFRGPDGVDRTITASVVVVGLVGAYAAIVGVYLAIAAFSLKWGTHRAPALEGGA